MMSRVIQCKIREQNQLIFTQRDGDRNIEHGHQKREPRDVEGCGCGGVLLWTTRRMDVSWGTEQFLHCTFLEEDGLIKGVN